MQYVLNITVPWDGTAYGRPWPILLGAQPWRHSETGAIQLQATVSYPQDIDPTDTNPEIPMNSARPRLAVSATRTKEIARLLKFGRDSNWPLSISVASSLDGMNSAVVTYQAEWEDCDGSEQWGISQWRALALTL
jgi:hypothetical protein